MRGILKKQQRVSLILYALNFFFMNAVLVCYLYSQMYVTYIPRCMKPDLIVEEFISFFMFIFGLYSGDKLRSQACRIFSVFASVPSTLLGCFSLCLSSRYSICFSLNKYRQHKPGDNLSHHVKSLQISLKLPKLFIVTTIIITNSVTQASWLILVSTPQS